VERRKGQTRKRNKRAVVEGLGILAYGKKYGQMFSQEKWNVSKRQLIGPGNGKKGTSRHPLLDKLNRTENILRGENSLEKEDNG